MSIPTEIRDEIRDALWATAEELGWSALSDIEKAKYYEQWTRDAAIGGRLGHFMDPRKVRVYIKDSLLKPYERTRMFENEDAVWRALQLPVPRAYVESYIKPHGKRPTARWCAGAKAAIGRRSSWQFSSEATWPRVPGHWARSSWKLVPLPRQVSVKCCRRLLGGWESNRSVGWNNHNAREVPWMVHTIF